MKSILLLLLGGWLALLSAFALLLALGGLFLVAWCVGTWVFVVFCCMDCFGLFPYDSDKFGSRLGWYPLFG